MRKVIENTFILILFLLLNSDSFKKEGSSGFSNLNRSFSSNPKKPDVWTLSFGDLDDDYIPSPKKDREMCDGKPGTRHINVMEDGTEEKGGFVAATAFVGEDVFLDKNSSVCDYASVEDEVKIEDEVTITENATISGKVKIKGKVRIDGYASVTEYAQIEGDDILITEKARVRGHAKIMDKVKIQGEATIRGLVTVKSNSVVKGYFEATGAQKVEGTVEENNDNSITSKEIEKKPAYKEEPLPSKGLSCRPSDAHSINYQEKTNEVISTLEKDQFEWSYQSIKIEGESRDFNEQNLDKINTCIYALNNGSEKGKRECESKGGIISSSEIVELDCSCEKKRLRLFELFNDDFICTAKGILKCKGGRDISIEDNVKLNIIKAMADQVLESYDFQNLAELSIKTFAEKNNLLVPEMPNTKFISYVMGIRNLYQQAKNIKSWIEEQTSLGKTNDLVMLQLDKMRDELKGQRNCLKILKEEMPTISKYLYNLPVLK